MASRRSGLAARYWIYSSDDDEGSVLTRIGWIDAPSSADALRKFFREELKGENTEYADVYYVAIADGARQIKLLAETPRPPVLTFTDAKPGEPVA